MLCVRFRDNALNIRYTLSYGIISQYFDVANFTLDYIMYLFFLPYITTTRLRLKPLTVPFRLH